MSHVTKRRVIHLAGYDPMSPERFHARFSREASRFPVAWGARLDVRRLRTDVASDDPDATFLPRWDVIGEGPGWRTEAEHVLLRWDDIIDRQRERPALARWPRGALALLDFIWNGALGGYLRHGPRYLMFYAFPVVLLLGCLAAGWLAAVMLGGLGPVAAALGGAAVSAGLLVLAGRKAYLDHLLDDWIFAAEVARRLDPEIKARLDAGARMIAETPADTELIVIGHSLGAALAVEMIADAVRKDPGGRPFTFLSLGSSILKIAVHRKAARLRDAVGAAASSPRLSWVDYSAVNDVMNFFRSDPVKALGQGGRSPMMRKASFARMLKPGYYKQIRFNFFRLHNQFISGNDLRAPYDYLRVIAGPFPLTVLARRDDGAIAWLDGDGALTESGLNALRTDART
jgi:hypothetical protein